MQLVFDYDGVIADSMEFMVGVLNEVAAEINFPKITKKEIVYWRQNGPRATLKKFKIPLTKFPVFFRKSIAIQKRDADKVEFFEGIGEIIRKIKEKGIKIGILSSNDVENIKINLKKHDLDIFDFIEGGAMYFGKAQKIRQLRRKVGDFVYVGDELRDIEACKRVGVPIIAVSWGFNDKKILKDADYVVDSPKEFLKLVLSLIQ